MIDDIVASVVIMLIVGLPAYVVLRVQQKRHEKDGTPERRPFVSDGCSCILCRLLIPARHKIAVQRFCREHDLAYWTGGTRLDRLMADTILMTRIARTVGPRRAGLFFLGVHFFGSAWLPTPWRWNYGVTWRKSIYRGCYYEAPAAPAEASA